jgi:putative phosphoserine phosphatase / 1-acylglycerol-3-phosphate O-acyltransferase
VTLRSNAPAAILVAPMKPLALLDVDNTLYRGLSLLDIAAEQVEASFLPRAALDAMWEAVYAFARGERTYEQGVRDVLEVWAGGLAGRPYDGALAAARARLGQPGALYEYARPLVDALRATHAIYLVTGSPGFTGAACAALLGADGYRASELEVADGTFTGRLGATLADRDEKRRAIGELLERHGRARSLAVGDSEGDIAMLDAVELPFAVNATPGLAAHAAARGWPLETPETILEALGAAAR